MAKGNLEDKNYKPYPVARNFPDPWDQSTISPQPLATGGIPDSEKSSQNQFKQHKIVPPPY